MGAINVAVIDDHELFREGVIAMLRRDPLIKVVGEGASREAALHIAAETKPDVMLIDVGIPGGGIDTARQLSRSFPDIKLVMLTVSETASDVVSAFEAGVIGYILKGIRKSELVSTVHAAYRGETVIAPSLAGRILRRLNSPQAGDPQAGSALNSLTPREAEVLELVAEGLSNKHVAIKLGLTERTIKNNMTTIMQKLKVGNRFEAMLRLHPRSPAVGVN